MCVYCLKRELTPEEKEQKAQVAREKQDYHNRIEKLVSEDCRNVIEQCYKEAQTVNPTWDWTAFWVKYNGAKQVYESEMHRLKELPHETLVQKKVRQGEMKKQRKLFLRQSENGARKTILLFIL